MSDNEQTSIDLSVNADAAVETMKELAAAALKADDAFQQLKQHQVELANAIPGNRPVSTYNEAAARFQQMDPSLIRDTYPAIAQTQNAITAQAANVRTQAMDFVGTNPQAAGLPASALLGQFQAFMAQQQQAQQASAGVNYQAPPPPPGQEGLRYGPAVPPEMDRLARYGYDKAQSMDARDAARQQQQATPFGSSGNDTTQQDRTASTMGERFAQALTRSAGGMLSGGISGAANAAGMGATGDLLSGLARPLMSMLGEFAAPLAAGAAVVGGALGVNSAQTHYEQEKQALSATEGTTTGATPSAELINAQRTGWQYLFHEQESVAAAQQLGSAGVSSSQMGGALNASLALARVGNISTGEAAGLTGQLMQAGQSPTQVGDTYAQMDQAARQTGVSLSRLISGVTELGQAAGVGQISVNGLAAAQALAGTSVNFAQASSGTVGSTGTGALAQAAMLGLSPSQFEQAQRSPAALMDSYANLAKRYDVGSGGVQVAQEALSHAGFDFSGMKGPQADEFTRRLVAQGPGAAQAYEASLTKKENAPGAPGPHNAADVYKAGVDAANRVTSAMDKSAIWAEQIAAKMALAEKSASNIADAASRDPRYTKSGTDLSAGPNRWHIQPTRPLQGDNTVPLAPLSPYDLGIGIIGSAPAPTPRGFVPNLPGLVAAQYQGLQVPNLAGSEQYASPAIVKDIVSAARADKLSPGVMLAQAAQESGFNPNRRAKDGGTGLFQFTDPGASRQYLGQASHELHRTMPSDWHQAALDPQVASRAAADYDKALLQGTHGNWAKAAAQYNAGPHGWDLTNKPGQGQMYGIGVAANGETVQHQLAISVTVQDQNGNKVGQTKTQHNIDTSKKVVAAQSYGPTGNESPTVGMPLVLPARIK